MKYSKEFKEEALKLSDEIGLKKAAQQLGMELSRNVQSGNTQNLGWAEVRQRGEPAQLKFLVPQVGDHLH